MRVALPRFCRVVLFAASWLLAVACGELDVRIRLSPRRCKILRYEVSCRTQHRLPRWISECRGVSPTTSRATVVATTSCEASESGFNLAPVAWYGRIYASV